jgi:hypothetical protein
LSWWTVSVLSAGCADPQSSLPFRPVADLKQLMAAVVEPAAEVYWDAVGSVVDEKGTTDFAPASDEEWIAVRNSAMVVAESGNLLMMASRARDQGDWIRMSQALVEAGKEAVAAAEAKDTEAVFAAGGQLYEACSGCHATYAVALVKPNAR